MWSVNARIKVAVVTSIQAAFGVSSSPACWFSCPGPGQRTGTTGPWSRGFLGMAVAARGCSAPRAGEEGAEPGKERVHSKETLLG